MTRKPFGFGNRSSSGPFYRPYRQDSINHIYNLLFCDDPALYRNGRQQGALAEVLSQTATRETLERIGNDPDAESRVRVLAFNRLRAMNAPVPDKRLLGAIIEVPQDNGLDVLAVFEDKRLRYINQSENVAVFEDTPPHIAAKARALLRHAQIAVNQIGPSDQPRRPPPRGDVARLTFLVSDGLTFGEGDYDVLIEDPMAAPILGTASELLVMVVEAALENRQDRALPH